MREPLSVFSAAYWRAARAEFRNVRVLALSGLVCAMAIVLESMPIYLLGPSLKIYFSYLAVSLGCMCYGPLVGMAVGGVIDSVGFLLAGYGEPYFLAGLPNNPLGLPGRPLPFRSPSPPTGCFQFSR